RRSARLPLNGTLRQASAAPRGALEEGVDLVFQLRRVVQYALVDGAELLDAEVCIGDALPTTPLRAVPSACGRRHQGVEHFADDGAGDRETLAERRVFR